MSKAFVFPGQGSQAVGMGQALAEASPAARLVFEEVDDALSQNLTKIMFEGPDDELRLTENAQPALMAVSMAIVRVLSEEGGVSLDDKADFVAGHSLGEYSALAAAGSFILSDTARLLKLRGQSMQEAVPVGDGAMAALLGLDFDAAKEVADEASQGEVCDVGNDNAPGQVVLSGATAAIERAVGIAKEKGARRAVLLPVSAPFHCSMLAPAAEAMENALGETEIAAPSPVLVANVTASSVQDPPIIRRQLVEQVTGMVRWRESVLYMKEQGVDTLIELGTGNVLTGLARRIDRELTGRSIQSPDDIEALLKDI
ncbi:MAG: ACP S-malonyltransferase [Pseudomonadota bacterium]|jgi:[acyl-carrier-protein] S-malonyltransferase|nr:ACP S-malonyltransferase [Pseudomonadota bacterium]